MANRAPSLPPLAGAAAAHHAFWQASQGGGAASIRPIPRAPARTAGKGLAPPRGPGPSPLPPLSFPLFLSALRDLVLCSFPVWMVGSPHSEGSLRILLRRPRTFLSRNPFSVVPQTSSRCQLAEAQSRQHLFQPRGKRRTEPHSPWGHVVGGVCWLPNAAVPQKKWKRRGLHVSRCTQQCTPHTCPRR